MSAPLTKKSTDRSDLKKFLFGFFCDRCGAEWNPPALPFEQGGFSNVDNEVVRQLIWEQEHKAAFDGANLEAHFHFSYCEKCGRWVCDDCANLEARRGEVCIDCGGKG